MDHHGETETMSMDSPLVEFEDNGLHPENPAPYHLFLGRGNQVTWGNRIIRSGVMIDPDHWIVEAQPGEQFIVSVAYPNSANRQELAGERAEVFSTDGLVLIESPGHAEIRHSIGWDTILAVQTAAVIDSPKCA